LQQHLILKARDGDTKGTKALFVPFGWPLCIRVFERSISDIRSHQITDIEVLREDQLLILLSAGLTDNLGIAGCGPHRLDS
jgi:hypothetical protein